MVAVSCGRAQISRFGADLAGTRRASTTAPNGSCAPGGPLQFSIVLGVRGGMAANADNLLSLVRRLPADAIWQVIAIGRANPELTAIGLALGGNARAGLEDTLHIGRGRLADGNRPLVERAARMAAALDRAVAAPQDAEKTLQLEPVAALYVRRLTDLG